MKTHVHKRDTLWLLTILGEKLARYFLNQFDNIMQDFRYYSPSHDIRDVAAKAQDILSLNHQYGEGWLLAGEIAIFAQDGVENVLCLQPFGCIANHVIAKGVQKRLQETYPQLNLLFLDADAGVSEVNFFNRMHFFVNQGYRGSQDLVQSDQNIALISCDDHNGMCGCSKSSPLVMSDLQLPLAVTVTDQSG